MAWPLDRLQDFIANALPVIKASTLNAIQDLLIAAMRGTVSFRNLNADGLGGITIVPGDPGNITASRSVFPLRAVSDTTVPTVSMVVGELAKGFVPMAWGRVTGTTGALKRGAGVYALSRTAAGVYSVTLMAKPGDAVNYATLVTSEIIGGIVIVAPQAAAAGRPVVQITIQVAGANTDANFSFACFGE